MSWLVNWWSVVLLEDYIVRCSVCVITLGAGPLCRSLASRRRRIDEIITPAVRFRRWRSLGEFQVSQAKPVRINNERDKRRIKAARIVQHCSAKSKGSIYLIPYKWWHMTGIGSVLVQPQKRCRTSVSGVDWSVSTVALCIVSSCGFGGVHRFMITSCSQVYWTNIFQVHFYKEMFNFALCFSII